MLFRLVVLTLIVIMRRLIVVVGGGLVMSSSLLMLLARRVLAIGDLLKCADACAETPIRRSQLKSQTLRSR